MKTTQIPALFVCIILISVCGITNAGEKKLVNVEVPLPDNVKIIAPTEDVPKDIAAFSGAWEGKMIWSGSVAALVVEEINSKEAKVIFSRGKGQGPFTNPSSYDRYKAIVTLEKMQIEFGSRETRWYIFSMENNLNQIKGIVKTPVGDSDIIMTKVR